MCRARGAEYIYIYHSTDPLGTKLAVSILRKPRREASMEEQEIHREFLNRCDKSGGFEDINTLINLVCTAKVTIEYEAIKMNL